MATVAENILQAQEESQAIEGKRPANLSEENIFKTLEFFDRYPNSEYKTYDDAKQLLESGIDPTVIDTIVTSFGERKTADKRFIESGGRDLNLMNDSLNKIILNTSEKDADLAKTLNFTNVKDNYNSIKEFLDDDDVYKLRGVDPKIGAPGEARLSFSFAFQNQDTINQAAHDAIVYTLPKDKQELYTGLNYKGPRIYVNNEEFADGKKRLVYKVPKELGGDEKVKLFNEPGEWAKDIVGYTPQIVQLVADATVGAVMAPGGPNAVALGAAGTQFATEYTRLLMGQLYFNQNKNMDPLSIEPGGMIFEAGRSAAITGGATRVLFPIANLINRSIRTAGATVGISQGNMSRKIIGDFVDAYKKGLSKDESSDQFVERAREQLTKPLDQGGAGMTKDEAKIFVNKTFAQNLEGNRITNLETIVKEAPKGRGMAGADQPLVSKELNQAAIEAEKISLNIQKKVISDITGVDVSKISALDTGSDAFKIAELIAKSDYRSNLIRQTDFTKKFLTEWDNVSKKYTLKLQPEEKNFNTVIQNFIDPVKTQNFATAEKLRGTINALTKDVKVSIPRTNINKGFVSPSKIFDESINGLNKTINNSKILKVADNDLQDLYASRNLLKNLKIKLKTKNELSYLEVEDTLNNLEFLKGKYPNLDQVLTKVETSLRAARSEVIKKLPDDQQQLITKNLFEFTKANSILRQDVLGKVINNLKGVRGPVAKNKALTAPDQFPVLFGNSQEQLAALRYIKSSATGGLTKGRMDELKSIMLDRFIRDVTPVNRGGNGVPVKKWLSQYENAYAQIFDPKEMTTFNSVINARAAVEKIVNRTLSMNQAAKNVFPTLKNLDITNITPANIATALFDPKLKPNQVKGFFSKIGPSQANQVKSYYLKTIFDNVNSVSPLLGRETLDGNKLLKYLGDIKNEQVFVNVFGDDALKNMKTIAASLSFMQKTSRYLGKEMTEAQQEKVRTAAFQVVYGPLSHQNVIMRNLIRLSNTLDNKLGKEFLDYDLFVEKFKKTYAFKYAPALNDKKFLTQFKKFDGFDTYDAGLLQRFYTGTVAATGASQAQAYEGLEDAGLPESPITGVSEFITAAGQNIPYGEQVSTGLDKILKFLETSPETNEKKKTKEQLKKIKKEKERQGD
jgi:hypothetical protein